MPNPNAMLLARADGRPAGDFAHAALGLDDPFGAVRQVAYRGDDGVSAGIVQGAVECAVEHYPYVETLVVHAGRVSLQDQHQVLQLGVGESAVIGRGTALRIQASADSLWAFCAYQQHSAAAKPGLTPLPAYAPLNPSLAPDEQILLGPAPQCRSHNAYADTASNLLIGVWDSTPYARRSRPHKVHELMHLIEGRVTLTLEGDMQLTVDTGDSVFVPLGVPCAWTSSVYVRKFYVVK